MPRIICKAKLLLALRALQKLIHWCERKVDNFIQLVIDDKLQM
jgi:hypothetical protein